MDNYQGLLPATFAGCLLSSLIFAGATQAASNAAVASERRTVRFQGRLKVTGPASRIEGALAQTLALWVE